MLIFTVCLISGKTAAISIEELSKSKENATSVKNILEQEYQLSDENTFDISEFAYPLLAEFPLLPEAELKSTQLKPIFILSCFSLFTFTFQLDVGVKFSSPEYGGGFSGLLGGKLKDELTSVYLLTSYHRYSFDGGYDRVIQIGLQGRRDICKNSPFWAGGELGWTHDKTVYPDGESHNPKANGFFIGPLGGYRLPIPNLDVSVFAGASLIFFGDFKVNGMVYQMGHTSTQIKLGAEITLPLSKNNE